MAHLQLCWLSCHEPWREKKKLNKAAALSGMVESSVVMTANRGARVLMLAALKYAPDPFPMKCISSSLQFFRWKMHFNIVASAWVITCSHSQAMRRSGNMRMLANGENVAYLSSVAFSFSAEGNFSPVRAAFISKAPVYQPRSARTSVRAGTRYCNHEP